MHGATPPRADVLMEKKAHRGGTHQHYFGYLCDAGCTIGVPNVDDTALRKLGWKVTDDDTYEDGKERICPSCAVVEDEPDDEN